jgi:hypothetical protein
MGRLFKKSGSLNLLEPSGPVKACNGIALPLPLPYITEHVADLEVTKFMSERKLVHHFFYTENVSEISQ